MMCYDMLVADIKYITIYIKEVYHIGNGNVLTITD